MMSCRRIGSMNSIASIATVATGPCARREATMPAAISIWLSTQPPKMWPLALMSPGRGTTRRIGSALSSVIVAPARGCGFVMAARIAEINEAHQGRAEQHGKADSGDRGDQHVDRDLADRKPQVEE